jgi:putative PIN family toxin of toxin-antitoxin system
VRNDRGSQRDALVAVRPAVIVDTNVVVAGLPIAGNPLPVAAILRDMLNGELRFVASVALLAEYREVLTRPALKRLHGLDDAALEALLGRLEAGAELVEAVAAAAAPDPGDQMLWELLAARADAVLVTSDKLLLRNRTMRGRIMTPVAFLACA